MIFTWLIDEDFRCKAQIKYEIKRLEATLHHAWCTSQPPLRKYSKLAQYCDQLIHHYRELLVCYPKSSATAKLADTKKIDLDIERCYAEVLRSKAALHYTLTAHEQGKALEQLYEAYQLFSTQLRASFIKKKNRQMRAFSHKPTSNIFKRYHPVLYHEEHTDSPDSALEQLFRLLENTPIT